MVEDAKSKPAGEPAAGSPADAEKTEEREETAFSPLEEAKIVLEENKKVLAQLTEERKKIEKAAANAMIGGRSFAGKQAEEKKVETPKEYKDRIMRGG